MDDKEIQVNALMALPALDQPAVMRAALEAAYEAGYKCGYGAAS